MALNNGHQWRSPENMNVVQARSRNNDKSLVNAAGTPLDEPSCPHLPVLNHEENLDMFDVGDNACKSKPKIDNLYLHPHRDSAVGDLASHTSDTSSGHKGLDGHQADRVEAPEAENIDDHDISSFQPSELVPTWPVDMFADDDGLEDFQPGPTWLLNAFQSLNEQRLFVAGLRYRIREFRRKLRRGRGSVVEHENQFMQSVRSHLVGQGKTASGPIMHEQERLQDFRNGVQEDEAEYDLMEDQLTDEEWELKAAEKNFYTEIVELIKNGQLLERRGVHRASSSVFETRADISSLDAAKESKSAAERWIVEHQKKMALQAELQKLVEEHDNLVSERESRAMLDLAIDASSEQFIRDFALQKGRLEDAINEADKELSQLANLLHDQGHSFFSLHQFGPGEPEISSSRTSDSGEHVASSLRIDEDEDEDWVRVSNDPLLFASKDTSPIHKDPNRTPRLDYISTIDHINEWLLHKLRVSMREVLYFKSLPDFGALNIEWHEFKALVLELWPHDSASRSFRPVQDDAASVEPEAWTNSGEILGGQTRSESYVWKFLPIKRSLD